MMIEQWAFSGEQFMPSARLISAAVLGMICIKPIAPAGEIASTRIPDSVCACAFNHVPELGTCDKNRCPYSLKKGSKVEYEFTSASLDKPPHDGGDNNGNSNKAQTVIMSRRNGAFGDFRIDFTFEFDLVAPVHALQHEPPHDDGDKYQDNYRAQSVQEC